MPLLTTLQTINARLAADASSAANHIASAAVLANRMSASILSLDDEQLTAWLNSQPRADIETLLTAHGQLGEAINAAAYVAKSVLTESAMVADIPNVDVRSIDDKLADRGRILTYESGTHLVTTLPTDPDQETETIP